jgi:hypothetical protein
MSEEEERVRKAKLIASIDSYKYGPRILRSLAVVALDLHKIDQMTDAELLSISGIGPKGLAGIRKHLAEYFCEDE